MLETFAISVNDETQVSACWLRPPSARAVFVFAHGAGAGMNHLGMSTVAEELAAQDIATLRYQFPYMERGSKRPDAPALCHATVRAAVEHAQRLGGALPVFAGGRSFGGRMTSQACAAGHLPGVRGLVFLAFPLHPAGAPATERAEHLSKVDVPMLFIQGTHDALATRSLLESVLAQLGSRASHHWLEAADHSFRVPAKSGRTDQQVRIEAVSAMTRWMLAVSNPET